MMSKLKYVIWSLIALQGLTVAECPKGTQFSKDGKRCVPCINGVNYTSYSNAPFCFSCTKCEKDQIIRSPCTITQDTQCECKPGKFINKKDSPEKCSDCIRCPGGIRSCSTWDDTQCANQKAFQPDETVDNHSGQSSNSSNCSICSTTIAVIAVVFAVLSLVLIFCLKFRSRGFPDCFKDWIPKIFVKYLMRVPEDLNNDTNNHYEMVSLNVNAPLATMVCEQELENQPQAPLIAQQVQSQGELEQVPIGAKQEKRKHLVPVEGTNTTESLRQLFNDINKIIPIHSWRPLMRRLGLTDNEICVAENRASDEHDKLYEMLVTWQNKKGMKASVNVLLDALEAQGEQAAKEEIQNLLLNSGNFIYEDDKASSVMPM